MNDGNGKRDVQRVQESAVMRQEQADGKLVQSDEGLERTERGAL